MPMIIPKITDNVIRPEFINFISVMSDINIANDDVKVTLINTPNLYNLCARYANAKPMTKLIKAAAGSEPPIIPPTTRIGTHPPKETYYNEHYTKNFVAK